MSGITLTRDELNKIVCDAYGNAAKIVREMREYPNSTVADALDAVAGTFR